MSVMHSCRLVCKYRIHIGFFPLEAVDVFVFRVVHVLFPLMAVCLLVFSVVHMHNFSFSSCVSPPALQTMVIPLHSSRPLLSPIVTQVTPPTTITHRRAYVTPERPRQMKCGPFISNPGYMHSGDTAAISNLHLYFFVIMLFQ